MHDITLITAIAGLVFGVLGAVLGIMNTWRAFDRDRIRVKVVPVCMFYGDGAEGFGIEVTNLSYFPVTITGIGFTKRHSDEHMPLALFPNLQGCRLPERMEPRTRFTGFLPIAACEHPNFATIHRAYADTACGRRFTGTSKALRHFIELRRTGQKA